MSDITRSLLRQAEVLRNNLMNHGFGGTDILTNAEAVVRDLHLEAFRK